MNKSGYIYILTNKSFKDNYIKIGYSVDVERRVRELSSSGLPYDYEIYCTYEILASQKKFYLSRIDTNFSGQNNSFKITWCSE